MTDNLDKTNQSLSEPSSASIGSRATFPFGHILGGKYRIISLLGRGGMGAVYRVQQVFLDKEFALKTLDRSNLSDVLMRRFQIEAKAASSLSHANLVQVYDFGMLDDGQPYLVMDLIDGITLADLVKTLGSVPLLEVAQLFEQVCLGLEYAHGQGVVHRDIKPSNIMLSNNLPIGAPGSVKVVDFGIAKLISHDDGEIQALTRTGEIFGSPLYMSPEQCLGGEIDHRTDIYSLGCVLFETLAGTPPHVGKNTMATMMLHQSQHAPTLKEASLGKEFPAAFQHIVDKMLRKSPAERYHNLGLVADDLASLRRNDASAVLPLPKTIPPKAERVVSMTTGQFWALLIMTVLITGLIAGLGGFLLKSHQIDDGVDDKPSSKSQQVSPLDTMPENGDPNDFTKANMAKLAKVDRITSTIVTAPSGLKQRQFEFPDCGIGVLTVWADTLKTKSLTADQTKCYAKGEVRVPADLPLTLAVRGRDTFGVIESPAFFEKLNPTDFCGLILQGGGLVVNSEEAERKNLAQIVTIVSRWPNMQSLEFGNLAVGKEVFDAVNKISTLRNFILKRPLVEPNDLLGMAFLKRQETLEFGQIDMSQITPQFSGSDQLRRLILDHTKVSAASLRELSQCRNLDYLEVRDKKLGDDAMAAICKIKSLRSLYLNEVELTDPQLRMLNQCRGLTEIRLGHSNPVRLKMLNIEDSRFKFMGDKRD